MGREVEGSGDTSRTTRQFILVLRKQALYLTCLVLVLERWAVVSRLSGLVIALFNMYHHECQTAVQVQRWPNA